MNDDSTLLRRFAEHADQAAFAELVNRHLPLVHSAAMRQVGGDFHLAADVAQTVFTDLARKAASLASHPSLVGWLYTGTHHASAKTVRTEQRRRHREQSAFSMNDNTFASDAEAEVDWTRLGPVLDEELQRLKEQERTVLLLRYFEHLSYSEIGRRTGLSENATRMKADRSLEKLRSLLSRRGISSTATILGTTLAGQAITMPPAGLAALITQHALTQAATLGPLTTTIGFFTIMKSITMPLALGGVLISAFVASHASQQATETSLRREIAALDKAASYKTPRRIAAAASATSSTEASKPGATSDSAVAQSDSSNSSSKGKDMYSLKELTRPPKPTYREKPVYPAEMRSTGIRGEAVVQFVVDQKGNVRSAQAVKSTHPAFAKAAVEALQKWKFDPGQKNGTAVKTMMQIPLVFEISSTEKNWF